MTNIAKHWFLIFIFIKSRAAVTGGRNSNATPAQSPNVNYNAAAAQSRAFVKFISSVDKNF